MSNWPPPDATREIRILLTARQFKQMLHRSRIISHYARPTSPTTYIAFLAAITLFTPYLQRVSGIHRRKAVDRARLPRNGPACHTDNIAERLQDEDDYGCFTGRQHDNAGAITASICRRGTVWPPLAHAGIAIWALGHRPTVICGNLLFLPLLATMQLPPDPPLQLWGQLIVLRSVIAVTNPV